MAIITTSLSKKIEQINNYLENKIEQESHDPNFLQELKLTIINCQKLKKAGGRRQRAEGAIAGGF